LTISGLVAQPVSLTLDDLRKLKQTSIEAMQMGGRGPVPLNCSGPALATVMAAATLALPEAKNANLRHTLLVTADDGYAVALSLGEIAENYGDAAPLLATACNGRPLKAPRLVLPRDKSAGRAVNGVVRIEVR
jgi:DMSO/TMAO reductase YedYZ molybdopterin-dependent catalytic subunit